jgi:hypothetical protein
MLAKLEAVTAGTQQCATSACGLGALNTSTPDPHDALIAEELAPAKRDLEAGVLSDE